MMLRFLLLLFALALHSPSIAAQESGRKPPFVDGPDSAVHGIALAEEGSLEASSWDGSYFHTDVDRDGIIDVPLWESFDSGRLVRGGDMGNHAIKFDLARGRLGGHSAIRFGVPLRRNGELVGAAPSWFGPPPYVDGTYFIMFWDFKGGTMIKKLFIPPAPGVGLPEPTAILHPIPLGDLDGDDCDEFLVQLFTNHTDPYLGIAVIDGATLDYKWVQYYPSGSASTLNIFSTWENPCQDIDGDGVKDIFLPSQDHGFPTSWKTRCVSGADGSEIWYDERPTGASFNTGWSCIVDDVNQDGIRDLFFFHLAFPSIPHHGFFRVQSGRDGSVIWEREVSRFDPLYSENPNSLGVERIFAPMPTGDMDGDGISEIVLRVIESDKLSTAKDRLWYLSGATGKPLSRDPLTGVSLYPWIDGIYREYTSGGFFLGDIDNDGWAEYVRNYPVNEDSLSDLIFFGRRTLLCPDEAQEGDTVKLSLHIPTGANKDFRILMSTAFDPLSDGYSIGNWRTHLLPTPLFNASRSAYSLRGTLDHRGKGSLEARIPIGAGLVGQEVFAVAMVLDNSRPDGIVTKSTVGVITVLP